MTWPVPQFPLGDLVLKLYVTKPAEIPNKSLWENSTCNLPKEQLPECSSIFVRVSTAVLCWPECGALSGTIVGTETAPAAIFSLQQSHVITSVNFSLYKQHKSSKHRHQQDPKHHAYHHITEHGWELDNTSLLLPLHFLSFLLFYI